MTETFDARWLALREHADHAARRRSARLTTRLRHEITSRATTHLTVVDLGAGTGSNLRFVAPRLREAQAWILCDHDAGLLAHALRRPRPANVSASARLVDLDALAQVPIAGATLVTASALLDLVGDAWLGRLVSACAGARAAVLFALDVDGRVRLAPIDRADRRVARDVDRDTRRDKGLGPALGTRAGARAAALLGAAGYEVWRSRSDWRLGVAQRALIDAWLRGRAAAASAAAPRRARQHAAWLARRQAALARGRLRVCVGHVDLAAWPRSTTD